MLLTYSNSFFSHSAGSRNATTGVSALCNGSKLTILSRLHTTKTHLVDMYPYYASQRRYVIGKAIWVGNVIHHGRAVHGTRTVFFKTMVLFHFWMPPYFVLSCLTRPPLSSSVFFSFVLFVCPSAYFSSIWVLKLLIDYCSRIPQGPVKDCNRISQGPLS